MIFNEKELLDIIRAIVREELALAIRIQPPIEIPVNGLTRKYGNLHPTAKQELAKTRVWNRFYAAVGELVLRYRKGGKKFVSLNQLRIDLLTMRDDTGEHLFIKNGVEIPMSVVTQRLAPSQIPRQAKIQESLRGISRAKRDGVKGINIKK